MNDPIFCSNCGVMLADVREAGRFAQTYKMFLCFRYDRKYYCNLTEEDLK